MTLIMVLILAALPALANVQTTTEQAFVRSKPMMIASMKQRAQLYESYLSCEKKVHAVPALPADPQCPPVITKMMAGLQNDLTMMNVQLTCMNESNSSQELATCLQKKAKESRTAQKPAQTTPAIKR